MLRVFQTTEKLGCLLHASSVRDQKSISIGGSVAFRRIINLIRVNNVHTTPQQIDLRIQTLQEAASLEDCDTAQLDLHGHDVQFANTLQEIMDDPYIWLSEEVMAPDGISYAQIRIHLRRLLLSISLTGILPVSLFLQGIKCPTPEIVGGGSFGDVYCGVYEGQPVALKRLRAFLSTSEETKASIRKAFWREALFWKNLSHPHILPFLGVDDYLFSNGLCMVLPWVPNGNVRSLMFRLRETRKMTDRALFFQIHRWLREIADGVAYLHNEGVVHADLRGPNILIDADFGVRVADFGMALFNQVSGFTQGGVVSRWSAPELFDIDDNAAFPHPVFASDIYSLGHVVVELYTSENPFPTLNDFQVMKEVLRGARPPRPVFLDGSQMPDALWDLTCRCWAHEPPQRPSADAFARQLREVMTEFDY